MEVSFGIFDFLKLLNFTFYVSAIAVSVTLWSPCSVMYMFYDFLWCIFISLNFYFCLDFKENDHAHNEQDCAIFYPPYDYTWGDITCAYSGARAVCESP